MNWFRHTIALACAATLILGNAAAESQDSLRASLEQALTGNDLGAALVISADLYDAALAENDAAGAGAAAYSRAEILTAENTPDEAAKAYELCEDHYQSIGAAAQSLQCAFKAATAFQSASRPGTGLDKLQAVARELEAIGQERSGFAVGVYLALAEATLPRKLDRLDGAPSKRRRVIDYCENAMTALEAVGQTESELYASALLLKAEAQEDLKEYAPAQATYEAFIALYQSLPNHSEETLENAYNRYHIVGFEIEGSSNTITVADKDGGEITLTIQKKRKVRSPRVDGNKLADGAHANARITLAADGRVDTIEILTSEPNPKYGEALRQGVKHWRFIPPDSVSAADIPPFEYGIVFYMTRRN